MDKVSKNEKIADELSQRYCQCNPDDLRTDIQVTLIKAQEEVLDRAIEVVTRDTTEETPHGTVGSLDYEFAKKAARAIRKLKEEIGGGE